MSAPVIAFCNPRRRVGTTTLVYHLGFMFSDLGVPVVMVDLDPQVDLSLRFMGYADLRFLLSAGPSSRLNPTIYDRLDGASAGVSRGVGPALVPGDPRIAKLDRQAQSGEAGLSSKLRTVLGEGAESCGAALVLVDLGPNLGAFNRASLHASDFLVVPTTADFLARSAILSLLEALRAASGSSGPRPLGFVLRSSLPESTESSHGDLDCLGIVQPYVSLAEMAQEAHKPMFHLTEADGAMGSHFAAMQSARKDFEHVARRIAESAGVKIPQLSGA